MKTKFKAKGLFVAFLMMLLGTITCGDNVDVASQTATAKSAVMLGQPGIPGRSDQFVRSGGFISDPAAASWGTGRADVFVVNQNSTIDHGGLNPGQNGFAWWDNWGTPAPGHGLGGISVSSGRYGLLDLFVTALTCQPGVPCWYDLWHRRWDNGADSGWQHFNPPNGPSIYIGRPAAVSGAYLTDSVDVFLTGVNLSTNRNIIYHAYSDDGGATIYGWENLGVARNRRNGRQQSSDFRALVHQRPPGGLLGAVRMGER